MDEKRDLLYKLLNDAHQRSGYSYRDVAECIHIDHSYVGLILAHQRYPSRDILISLCGFAYRLSIEETNEILELANFPVINCKKERKNGQPNLVVNS